MACCTAAPREETPSLRKIELTSVLTVLRDTNSRSPISRYVRCVCR